LIDDPSRSVKEIAQRTGRSARSIAGHRWQRGLASRGYHPWTDEELAILEAMWDWPIAEVAAVLGRSHRAIIHRRVRFRPST
jgi:hypothetical protein